MLTTKSFLVWLAQQCMDQWGLFLALGLGPYQYLWTGIDLGRYTTYPLRERWFIKSWGGGVDIIIRCGRSHVATGHGWVTHWASFWPQQRCVSPLLPTTEKEIEIRRERSILYGPVWCGLIFYFLFYLFYLFFSPTQSLHKIIIVWLSRLLFPPPATFFCCDFGGRISKDYWSKISKGRRPSSSTPPSVTTVLSLVSWFTLL